MNAARGDLKLTLPRHTLVWIAASARDAVAASAADETARLAAIDWLDHDLPLIVRRRDLAHRSRDFALGLPLPPAQGKRRIALRATARAIARHAEPPSIHDVVDRLPMRWRGPLSALGRFGGEARPFRVVGALLWQALTGRAYLHARSDADLVRHVVVAEDIDATCQRLARWEARYRIRADGELLFPDGRAVAWREWWTTPRDARVLVKRVDGVALAAKADLLRFVTAAHHERAA